MTELAYFLQFALDKLLFSCWNDNNSPAQCSSNCLSFKQNHHGSRCGRDDRCSHTRGHLRRSEQTVWKCGKTERRPPVSKPVVSKLVGEKGTWKKSCQRSPWHRRLTSFTCRSLRQTPLLSLWSRLYTADTGGNQTGGREACVRLKSRLNRAAVDSEWKLNAAENRNHLFFSELWWF